MTLIFTEWCGHSYKPSRIAVPAGLIQAITCWIAEQDGISGTARVCQLDCHGGCYTHGDELRQHRGRWNAAKLKKIATLVGFDGKVAA